MAPEILFKREKICERLGVSKEAFYKIADLPDSPIKKIADIWVCNLEEMAEWVKGRKNGRREGKRRQDVNDR